MNPKTIFVLGIVACSLLPTSESLPTNPSVPAVSVPVSVTPTAPGDLIKSVTAGDVLAPPPEDCHKKEDDAGFGGTDAECDFTCSAGSGLSVHVWGADEDASVSGSANCGGAHARCHSNTNECDGIGGPTSSAGSGDCEGSTDEFISSEMTVTCGAATMPTCVRPPVCVNDFSMILAAEGDAVGLVWDAAWETPVPRVPSVSVDPVVGIVVYVLEETSPVGTVNEALQKIATTAASIERAGGNATAYLKDVLVSYERDRDQGADTFALFEDQVLRGFDDVVPAG